MVSLVNSHANTTRIGWHLWEIDLNLPLGYLQGGVGEALRVASHLRILGFGVQGVGFRIRRDAYVVITVLRANGS